MKLLSCLTVLLLIIPQALRAADKGEFSSDKDKEAKHSTSSRGYTYSIGGITSTVGTVYGDHIVADVIVRPGKLFFGGKEIFNKTASPLIGSGKSIVKTWPIIGAPQKIRAHGKGILELISGDTNQVHVRADDNIHEHLSVSLSGDELVLQQKEKTNFNHKTPITYTVQLSPATLKWLNSIITGMTTRIKTPLTVKKLFLEANSGNSLTAKERLTIEDELSLVGGSGSITLKSIAAKQLVIEQNGSDDVDIESGEVAVGTFNIRGTGSVRAEKLRIDTLELNQSGDSLTSCKVLTIVKGSLSNGGFSNYGNGNPRDLLITEPGIYQQATD